MQIPWAKLAAYAVVSVVVPLGAVLILHLAERAGLSTWDPLSADTWHGRPVSQREHEPSGPQLSFLVFLGALFLVFVGTLLVLDVFVGG